MKVEKVKVKGFLNKEFLTTKKLVSSKNQPKQSINMKNLELEKLGDAIIKDYCELNGD